MFTDILDDLRGVLCDLIDVVKVVIGVIAVFVIVYAGANYIFFAHSPQDRDEAKEKVIQAMVGLLIVVVAGTFVDFLVKGEGYCSLCEPIYSGTTITGCRAIGTASCVGVDTSSPPDGTIDECKQV